VTDGGRGDDVDSGDDAFEFSEDAGVDGGAHGHGAADADDADDPADSEPLGGLARRLDERDGNASRGDDAFDALDGAWDDDAIPADGDELFEEMDVSDVDTDALWDSVLGDEPGGAAVASASGDGREHDGDAPGGREGEGVDDSETRHGGTSGDDAVGASSVAGDAPSETVVPKGEYCESCYFFTDPPAVGCRYAESEIVEIVDSEQFRVRNCPVVAGVVDTDGTDIGGDGDGDGGEGLDAEVPSPGSSD
jgi:hypothetical protein